MSSYLEGNAIDSLEGLENCFRLQELHLSNQRLSASMSFSFGLETMETLGTSLRVLNLSNCNVASLQGLLPLQRLEQLDLSKNKIQDIEQVYEGLGSLKQLKELDLSQNPVTLLPKYREHVIIFSSSRLGTYCVMLLNT